MPIPNAKHERLSLLLEELGECQQIIGKILRHGFESWHPEDASRTTNRELLEKEVGHVLHALDRMCFSDDIDPSSIKDHAYQKGDSVERYLHHQSRTGYSSAIKELLI